MKTPEEMIEDRDDAINEARWILNHDYFVLDTETTGLKNAEMCQLAIYKRDGTTFKSLVKPTVPIEPGAMNVHHITDEMVKDAPDAATVIVNLPNNNSFMVIYNAKFDLGIIKHSLEAVGSFIDDHYEVYDAMEIYSKFRGEWNDYYGNYRWHKLEAACSQCGIVLDLELHDALSDAIMTDRLLRYIGEQKLSWEA